MKYDFGFSPPAQGLRRRGAQLGKRLLVEREDEVRLRLHAAVEVVRQRRVVERDPRAQEVLLQHRLRGGAGVTVREVFQEGAAGSDGCAHSPEPTSASRPGAALRNVDGRARAAV